MYLLSNEIRTHGRISIVLMFKDVTVLNFKGVEAL
jgi:hypothetical protein